MRIDIGDAVGEMLGYLKDFAKVLEEGSIDERCRVLRAFEKEIRLDANCTYGRSPIRSCGRELLF